MNGVFENKKAIVIGGSSGIGLATAQMLANSKANVTITGRVARAEEIADAIVFTLGNSYLTGTVIHCDGGFSC